MRLQRVEKRMNKQTSLIINNNKKTMYKRHGQRTVPHAACPFYLCTFDRRSCHIVVFPDSGYNQKHTLNSLSNILSSLITIDNDTLSRLPHSLFSLSSLSEHTVFFSLSPSRLPLSNATFINWNAQQYFFCSVSFCIRMSYVCFVYTCFGFIRRLCVFFFASTQCSIVVIMCKLQFSLCD